MFENEAKEKVKRKIYNFIVSDLGVSQIITGKTCETVEGMPHFYQYSLEKMWQEGAEYGYNTAFVEADKNLKAIVTDINKANEWHFVSKEGFPNKDDIYLIIRSDGLHLGDYCCGGDGDIDCQSWCDYPSEEEIQDDSVIAWKEITLPEEEVLAEEMERQRIANYDFERGDVKY